YGSQNIDDRLARGNSLYDVRHTASAAFSYEVPNFYPTAFSKIVLHDWSLDCRFSTRTGFPVPLNGSPFIDPASGQLVRGGLNLEPGEPLYLYDSNFPGGRSVNPAAFSAPPPDTFGDAPRNFVRGFGSWQADLALRREFPFHEQLKLQFRAE